MHKAVCVCVQSDRSALRLEAHCTHALFAAAQSEPNKRTETQEREAQKATNQTTRGVATTCVCSHAPCEGPRALNVASYSRSSKDIACLPVVKHTGHIGKGRNYLYRVKSGEKLHSQK